MNQYSLLNRVAIICVTLAASPNGMGQDPADLDKFFDKFIASGYQLAEEQQGEINQRIDEQIEPLRRLLQLAEKSSKIIRKVTEPTLLGDDGVPIDTSLYDDPVRSATAIAFQNAKEKKAYIESKLSKIESLELLKNTRPRWSFPHMATKDRMETIGMLTIRLKVVQVIGDGTFLAKYAMNEYRNLPMMLVAGFANAHNLVDDSEVLIDNPVACIRLHRYESAGGGTRTVEVLDVCDPRKIEAAIDSRVPKEDRSLRENKPKLKSIDPRTWSDVSGKFSVIAKFKAITEGRAILVKNDDSEISIPIDRLSQRDRDWITNWTANGQ